MDMSERCGTCKHWQRHDKNVIGWCHAIQAFPLGDEDIPVISAHITYELGDAIYLVTPSDFGCTKWEAE